MLCEHAINNMGNIDSSIQAVKREYALRICK